MKYRSAVYQLLYSHNQQFCLSRAESLGRELHIYFDQEYSLKTENNNNKNYFVRLHGLFSNSNCDTKMCRNETIILDAKKT